MITENRSVKTPKYIVLWNPHSEEWLMFHYDKEKDEYAPTYGCPIYNGKTPEECIEGAIEMWNIKKNEIKIA